MEQKEQMLFTRLVVDDISSGVGCAAAFSNSLPVNFLEVAYPPSVAAAPSAVNLANVRLLILISLRIDFVFAAIIFLLI
jgi:hypothetical protein